MEPNSNYFDFDGDGVIQYNEFLNYFVMHALFFSAPTPVPEQVTVAGFELQFAVEAFQFNMRTLIAEFEHDVINPK